MEEVISKSNKIELTHHQKMTLYHLLTGIKEKKLKQQTLGGYAGTGKTTLIRYLTKFFPDYAVAAYTGKAANVLRRKGIMASTIHSRIYKPYIEEGRFVCFDLADDPQCDGFIIDESSMVTREIYDDLCSYNLPMIYVGDHGQLEPVDSDFNLMAKPDYTLEEIHRNAGDIPHFAERLRHGFVSRSFRPSDGTLEFITRLDDELLSSVDQVICAYNATRVAINERIRNHLQYKTKLVVGEKVMCLRNNKELGLFNGMQGTVRRIYKKKTRNYIDFEFDGIVIPEIWYNPNVFGTERYTPKNGENKKDTPNPFDYAYCITAHKSQGDEFDSTLVIEQICKMWDHKRWAYTAASRSKNKLYWKVA